MFEQKIEVLIEIPSNIVQSEVWAMEERLKQVEGVEVDLQEPKDVISIATFILHLSISIMGAVAIIGSGIKSINEVAKALYEFLHHADNEKVKSDSKKKVVITKKG